MFGIGKASDSFDERDVRCFKTFGEIPESFVVLGGMFTERIKVRITKIDHLSRSQSRSSEVQMRATTKTSGT